MEGKLKLFIWLSLRICEKKRGERDESKVMGEMSFSMSS